MPESSEREFEPAQTLSQLWSAFNPNRTVDPRSKYYIPRTDVGLSRLSYRLRRSEGALHAFLCGHRGSGKTTELKRLLADDAILERYFPIYLTTTTFGDESVDLTHDALLVEIGLALADRGRDHGMDEGLAKELDRWGREVVETYLHDKAAVKEAGAGASAWIAFFKAQLKTRREWRTEEQRKLEPKVQDLVGIVNRMAQELKNKVDKDLLVVMDDLEKGQSDAHKAMHRRIFQDSYETLVQPRFSIVYTIPVYFRALPGRRVPDDQLFSFPAMRLYHRHDKRRSEPPLDRDLPGYRVMRKFIEQRLAAPRDLIEEAAVDELILIGGGLFRETARAVSEAAFMAEDRGAQRIELQDASRVFHEIKKGYQPAIRGPAIAILKAVVESEQGWVSEVEPFLQSGAVVEYENDDLWLDLRYVLKSYVRQLAESDERAGG